jgi:hypothetical protein
MSNVVREALQKAVEEGVKEGLSKASNEPETREWPVVVKLIEPVTIDGHKYAKLTFRSPRGRDWARAEQTAGSKLDKMHAVLASLAEVPEDVFLEMDHRDHLKCLEVARDFFSDYEMALLDPVSLLS